MTTLLFASVVLVLLAVLLRAYARLPAGDSGPFGRPLYIDTGKRASDLLVSERYQLIGRPDYILEEHGEQIPVERKPRMLNHAGPHESERLQLAACCLLVEERQGRPVHRGRLQYQNCSLDIPFDEALRRKLLTTLVAIQACSDVPDVRRSHPSPSRCLGCEFRTQCTESLAR
jgi:CRISPR/Cas system-associated exonuclease Cas4 (RecB family)